MKIISEEQHAFIIRFNAGNEVMAMLAEFCRAKNVRSGSFTAIGAISEAVLAFYDLKNKAYHDKAFNEPMEIVSLAGNVAMLDGKTIIHAHGSFSDKDMNVIGGHVKKLVVSATCELTLTVFEKPLQRDFDEDTGLNLLR